MKENLENNEWKKEAPLLASLPPNNPFSIPEGYFLNLSANIANGIYLEDLKTNVTETGFTIPVNYFNDLNNNIHAEIIANNFRSTVPSEGYTVPVNYFEQLQSNILSKTITKTPASSKTRIVRLWHSNLLKYASAACFVIVAGAGLYFNLYQQNVPQQTIYRDVDAEQMLFDIDEQVIIEHIESNYQDQQNQTVSEAALENYILNNYSQNDLTGNL